MFSIILTIIKSKYMSNPLIHFDVKADDVERAKSFYQNVFGWEITQLMTADKNGFDYWGVTTREPGTPGINGGLMKRTTESLNYECTIQVDDIDKAIADIKSNGGTITREKSELPGVGFMASAKDSEGNPIGLMQATDWEAK